MEEERVEQNQQIFTVYCVLGIGLDNGDTVVTKRTGAHHPTFMWKTHQQDISMSRIISDSDKYCEEHGIS